MEELERQGKKIPEDVAVTGYDNSLYARQGQGITTITPVSYTHLTLPTIA